MVSSPSFNVSMFIWSLPVAAPFFISRIVASTLNDVISGASFGSDQCELWYYVHCLIDRCNFFII